MSHPVLAIGNEESEPIRITLAKDGRDVDVYADGELVLWFTPLATGQVQVKRSHSIHSSKFVLDDANSLSVV